MNMELQVAAAALAVEFAAADLCLQVQADAELKLLAILMSDLEHKALPHPLPGDTLEESL